MDGVLSKPDVVVLRAELQRFFSEFGASTETETHKRGLRSDHIASTTELEAWRLGLPMLAKAILLLKSIGHELAVALNGTSGKLTLPPHVRTVLQGTSMLPPPRPLR